MRSPTWSTCPFHVGLFLYSWGSASNGQLGHGAHLDDVYLPKLVESDVVYRKVKQIAGGGSHTLLITDDNSLFACGCNENGQLGLDPTYLLDFRQNSENSINSENSENSINSMGSVVESLSQVRIPDAVKLVNVACGWNHSMVLTEEGMLYAFGHNAYHQLGLGEPLKEVLTQPPKVKWQSKLSSLTRGSNQPVPLLINPATFGGEKVTQVACGMRHTAAVTDSGFVYTWGDGRHGQLGHGNQFTLTVPTKIKSDILASHKIIQVACGARHTLCLSDSGLVFSWGEGRFGHLGHGDTNSYFSPKRIDFLQSVTSIACGWNHSIVLAQGNLFSFGRNNYGQLGLGHKTDKNLPQRIPTLGQAVSLIACGAEHTIILTELSEIFSFGWSEHGQLGLGSSKDELEPMCIGYFKNKHPVKIAAGSGFSMALCVED